MIATPDLIRDPYAREDLQTISRVADALRPRLRQRPSEWARANIRLGVQESPNPGPYDPDFLPWLADLLDLEFDEPHKTGMIGFKGTQIGWSVMAMIGAAWAADTDGGPQLYMIGDANQARHYADTRFLPIARSAEGVREKLSTGELAGRKTMQIIPVGTDGRIDFAGAGSAADFLSRPYRRITADELQLIASNFPRQFGDPVTMLEGRTVAFRLRSWVAMFGNPTLEGDRLDVLYKTISDQREWVWDCPHCDGTVRLAGMDQVHFEKTEDGEPTAEGAVLRCPCCGEVITDSQRARAVWPPRLGGTGRFESDLEPEEAALKRYVGIRVHGLCHPGRPIRDVARGWLDCPTDAEKQGFCNTVLGWSYRSASSVITINDVDELIERSKKLSILPGPDVRGGVRFVVCGADVQSPKSNPTFYATPLAAMSTGDIVVLDWWKISGISAMLHALGQYSLPLAGAEGAKTGVMGISCFAPDDRYATSEVLDMCRNAVYSEPTGQRVRMLPLGYAPKMTDNELPWLQITKEHRVIDPSRPHLGPIERYDLRRHCWVDRVMTLQREGRIYFLKPPDAKIKAQLTSNVLQPKKNIHGLEPERSEWMLPKGLRDDWLQAIAYGLAALVIVHRLDSIHELEMPAAERERKPPPQSDDRPTDWLGRVDSSWLG